jgi:hypothetical protein
LVRNAYASGDFEFYKNLLVAANEAGCPLNKALYRSGGERR